MNLYLMRHGLANPKETDQEESLSEKGKQIIEISAKALKKMKISFDVIICSPKKRSKQTAEIIAKTFIFPQIKIIESNKVAPNSPAEETLDFIANYEKVFIVGHLPSIKEIISYLLYPTSSIDIDIDCGGCTWIETNKNFSILKWHLTSDILKLILK